MDTMEEVVNQFLQVLDYGTDKYVLNLFCLIQQKVHKQFWLI